MKLCFYINLKFTSHEHDCSICSFVSTVLIVNFNAMGSWEYINMLQYCTAISILFRFKK